MAKFAGNHPPSVERIIKFGQ